MQSKPQLTKQELETMSGYSIARSQLEEVIKARIERMKIARSLQLEESNSTFDRLVACVKCVEYESWIEALQWVLAAL
jgi:hypothetical protein